MEKQVWAIFGMVGLLVSLSLPENIFAFTISVKIGDEAVVSYPDTNGDGTHSQCLVEGNHTGGIVIGRKTPALGCPKVSVTSDHLGDNIKITNLKVSKQAGNPTVADYRIAVYADLGDPPHSEPKIGYYWDHTNGSLVGAGSKLQIASWYQHPAADPENDPWTCTGTWNAQSELCGTSKTPGSWAALHHTYQPPAGITMSTGTRYLMAEHIFTLVGATANWTVSTMLVQATSVGEGGERPTHRDRR
jgi:hypothetical protein